MFKRFKKKPSKFGDRMNMEGELAIFHFRIWSDDFDTDSMITQYLSDYGQERLEKEIQERAKLCFPGQEVRVEYFSITPSGSIDIHFVLNAINIIVIYGGLRVAVDYFVKDIEWILGRVLPRNLLMHNPHIEGSWLPGELMYRIELETAPAMNTRYLRPVIYYLIITNAILIAFLLTVLIQALVLHYY
jgi:hypothetical protein